MRFLTFAIAAICVISFTVFAASNSEETKDTQIAANISSDQTQTDNVQGLATTDRRYRYHD